MGVYGERIEDVTVIESTNLNILFVRLRNKKILMFFQLMNCRAYSWIMNKKMAQQEKEEQVLQASTNNQLSTPNRNRIDRGRGDNDYKNLQIKFEDNNILNAINI